MLDYHSHRVGVSSNGRTLVFGARRPGSNPGTPAKGQVDGPGLELSEKIGDLMKRIKLITIVLAVVVLLIALCGCGGDNQKVGQNASPKKSYADKNYVVEKLDDNKGSHNKSNLEGMYQSIAPDFDAYFYFRLFPNGTFISPMVNGGGGTYYILGNEIHAVDTEEDYTGTISNDSLTLVDKTGMKFTFALSSSVPEGTSAFNSSETPELVDSDPILGDWEMTKASTADGTVATPDQLLTARVIDVTPTLKFAKTHTMIMNMYRSPSAGTWSSTDGITYVLKGGNADSSSTTGQLTGSTFTLTQSGNSFIFEKVSRGTM